MFAIFIAAISVNFLFAEPHLALNLQIAVGNTLEAYAGYLVFFYVLKKMRFLGHFSKFLAVFFISSAAPLVAAIFGASALVLHDVVPKEAFLNVLMTWAVGDGIGAILVVPIFLLFFKSRHRLRPEFRAANKLEKYDLIYLLLSAIPIYFVFFVKGGSPYLFLLFLSLLITSIKLDIKWTYFMVLVMTCAGIGSALRNYGIFSGANVNENIIKLQIFMYGVAMTAMLLEYLKLIGSFKIPATALFIGWLISGSIFFGFVRFAAESDAKRFKALTNKILERSENTVDIYLRALESGAALIYSSDQVTSDDWRDFASTLKLEERYPGMNGIGVINQVQESQVDKFLKNNNLTLKTVPGGDEKDLNRNEISRLIITYLEPFEKNKKAFGLDISSEKNRRDAALYAIQSKSGAITRKIILVQDEKKGPGFLFYYPVFKNGQLVSLVYSPVIFEKFMGAVLKDLSDEIDFEVYSSEILTSDNLMFAHSHHDFNDEDSELIQQKKMAGTTFSFEFKKSAKFQSSFGILPALFGLIGCLLSLFISIIISNLEMVNRKAKRLVSIRENQLYEVQAAMVHGARLSALGQMAGGIAHEINNPLAIISGKASQVFKMANSGNFDNQKLIDLSNSIVSTVERITKIVKNLKLVARDGQKDPMVPVSLAFVLDNVISLCNQKFSNHNVKIDVPSFTDLRINCREVQISQVLTNLLNNSFDAIQGTENKWIKIEIDAATAGSISNPKSMVHVRVSDSGLGIPEEVLAKLMTPFFTTKDPGKGTGLGLSLSRSIIKDHGGDFYYELHDGHTSFVIVFPVVN